MTSMIELEIEINKSRKQIIRLEEEIEELKEELDKAIKERDALLYGE